MVYLYKQYKILKIYIHLSTLVCLYKKNMSKDYWLIMSEVMVDNPCKEDNILLNFYIKQVFIYLIRTLNF